MTEEVVEQLFPGCRVHRDGRGQDAVEVEQAGADTAR
jgi:hypothetical protein